MPPKLTQPRPPLPDGWTRQLVNGTEWVYDHNGTGRCGSWNRAKTGICRSHPVEGRNRCRFHGGRSPSGANSPNFVHGNNSKYAPALEKLDVIKEFMEIRQDPDLLRLDDDIALMALRIKNLIEQLSQTPSVSFKGLSKTTQDIRSALRRGDNAEAMGYIMALLESIEEGARQEIQMGELYSAMEMKRKLIETETKRRVQASKVLTADEVGIIIAKLHQVIEANVERPEIAKKIGYELMTIVSDTR